MQRLDDALVAVENLKEAILKKEDEDTIEEKTVEALDTITALRDEAEISDREEEKLKNKISSMSDLATDRGVENRATDIENILHNI